MVCLELSSGIESQKKILPLKARRYNFTLVVKKGSRTAAASVAVKVVGDKNVPFLAFDDITIRGFQCVCNWATNIIGKSVKIKRNRLFSFETFILSLKSNDFMSLDGWPVITFTTAGPPVAGQLKVFRTADCTLTCEVTLDASGWRTHIDRYPLSYQFAYSQSLIWKMYLDTPSSKAIVRNVKLPCGISKVTVAVCDAFGFCSHADQTIYLPCSVPETAVLLTAVEKLLSSGYYHSTWSLLNPIRKAFSAGRTGNITGYIEDNILLVLEQYRLGLQVLPHLKFQALDELVTVLEVLHKPNNMKAELVNFKDEIIKTLVNQTSENQEKDTYSDIVLRGPPISDLHAKAMFQVLEYHMELNMEDNFDSKKRKSSRQVIHDVNVINMGVCHSLNVNKVSLNATFPHFKVYIIVNEAYSKLYTMFHEEISIPSLLNPAKHVSIIHLHVMVVCKRKEKRRHFLGTVSTL
ncbi:uncharacterized protein LOC111088826 [Limulus polyphemus]|uniref:Uncharacterized protein LOC111088826 n=1 Tax=Limulus polyphemus TaxID=6850 RepID=A0ABM1TIA6_LIMPO|nr:uncharacterized protein LOC111088826 [Limulus polyphemus]